MAIIFLFLIICLLRKDIKSFKVKQKIIIYLLIALYIIFMIYYTNYINNSISTIGYGIPGADMLAHFRGAELLSKGASWSDLSGLASRFEEIGINTIGYFMYTSFISLCIFFGDIFPVGFNVYVLYIFQLLLSIDTCVKFSKIFVSEKKTRDRFTCFLMFALCIPFIVQASQLMRDIYYMWFLALLFEEMGKFKFYHGKKKRFHIILSLIYAISCILIRFYSAILFIPLCFYILDYKRIAKYVVIGENLFLLFGSSLLNVIKEFVGIPWSFTIPNINESLSFLIFPNILNQSKYLFHWTEYFSYLDVGGCNVPGIYYLMSVWNIWILPLAIIGLFKAFKNKNDFSTIVAGILVAIVMLYSITYDAIDTRHKFFMVIPLVSLAIYGINAIKNKKFIILYNCAIAMFVIFILLFAI